MSCKLTLSGMSADRMISYLGLLTAAGLVAVLVYSQRVLSEVRQEAALAGESVYLDRIRTETLGWPLPEELAVTGENGEKVTLRAAARDASVIWIVDPTECAVCKNEARLLNRMVISVYPNVMTVLSGVTASEAKDLVESWDLRTSYAVDTKHTIRQSMGLILPSSFFIINRTGNVVHVEAHRGDQPCRNDVLELARRLLDTRAEADVSVSVSLGKESTP